MNKTFQPGNHKTWYAAGMATGLVLQNFFYVNRKS